MEHPQREQQARPARYTFYDKLKLRLSLRAMDIIIYVVIALIVVALVVGVLVD